MFHSYCLVSQTLQKILPFGNEKKNMFSFCISLTYLYLCIMKIDPITLYGIHRPMYIMEESRLRKNLSIISDIARQADVEIILAFKAFALWKTFPVFREYIKATTASSLFEARLAKEEFGSLAHTYSPAYSEGEIDELARYSSHLTFNSLSQYDRFAKRAINAHAHFHGSDAQPLSVGIRINPAYSEVETLLYNPCAPGTRFGVSAERLPEQLPDYMEGFHCHCHCENGSDVFARTLLVIEEKFSKWFPQLKWINFGGGHLMTRKDYDRELLIRLMKDFHKRYPWLKVILEPGSAFAWETGPLVSQIVDIVEDNGIKTAILNVSFTCHMPDCLEMPYMPTVRDAVIVDDPFSTAPQTYRLGGNSCLSGDFMGCWAFPHDLSVGDNIIFEDMIHYTTVKTNMFNGVGHPSIAILHTDNGLEVLRDFGYEDYKSRMD